MRLPAHELEAVPSIISAASYTTSASVAPATAPRGSKATITVAVKSSSTTKLLVDLEVYSPSGQKVFRQIWDNQSFTAGQQRTFGVAWSVPASSATGAYSIKIGLFSPGWGTLYHWNDSAGLLNVSAGATSIATAVPTALPTTTAVPTATPGGTGRYFSTLPVGSALPSDAECTAAIKHRSENKRMNASYTRWPTVR